jgi:hypothetical protein
MNKIRELEVRFTNAGVAFYKAGIALMDECEREWAKCPSGEFLNHVNQL